MSGTEIENDAVKKIEGLLAEGARIERRLTDHENKLNSDIDILKTRAVEANASSITRLKEINKEISRIAKLNKKELFPDKAKSREFAFGTIGFRRGSKKIVMVKGIKSEDVINKLKDYGYNEGVKIEEHINLAAMNDWSDDKLENVCLRRQQGERFFVEIKTEKLSQN